MPEFEVTVVTTRVGTHTLHVEADSAVGARELIRGECEGDQCHCPPEWCTDDVESAVLSVREVSQYASRALKGAESVPAERAKEHDRMESSG
jgi:hypothetical protein